MPGSTPAQDNPSLKDRGFETIGQPGSPWRLELGADGFAKPERVEGFQGPVLHLRDASCSQSVSPPAGLYELAAIAWGRGELTLAAEGLGERSQTLGRDRAVYGFLFQSSTAGFSVSARIRGEGFMRALAMRPATEDQAAAWRHAQDSIRQLGFAKVSPQRPAPHAGPPSDTGENEPLFEMKDRVVIDEPLMNTGHVVNEQRLVQWLADNGFRPLSAAALADWMKSHVTNKTAYGSVAVLCRGIAPANLLEGAKTEPLWLSYLRAGGRIVHVGDLPFCNYEYADVKPPMPDAHERGLNLLGMEAGWQSPYWGRGDRPVTPTQAARDWGLEEVDSSVTGFPVEAVSAAFGTFTTPSTGGVGATAWFKNVRADAPWSGLVKLRQQFDGNEDAALRDVWRAATHVGHRVDVPRLPPPIQAPVDSLRIDCRAGGIAGRHEWVRGEVVALSAMPREGVTADGVRFEFKQGSKTLLRTTVQVGTHAASLAFDTAPWAVGTYELVATALLRGRDVASARRTVGIRHVPTCDFPWMIWHRAGPNGSRNAIEFEDIREKGMEVLLSSVTPVDCDAAVRAGMGFALRIHTDLGGPEPPEFDREPECFRLDANERPIATAYSGGRPSLGLSHPRMRANAAASVQRPLVEVGKNPAFRPYALCNDDYSIYYGWDYSPHVVAAFERAYGRPPPRERPQLPPTGRLSDDDPWLQWFQWTLINVNGGFNRAVKTAATKVRPDLRIGPIPGAMQIPFVDMNQPAQYPPFNFGANGFNLIASYYYNTFWQPVLTTSFWMEIGRMGNRGLPQWNMPDALGTTGYTRSNCYHYLMGGVHGLAYFQYASRSEAAWEELERLGRMVRRIGPLQSMLESAPRDVALLNSFTTSCYEPSHTLEQSLAYHNLMQAHYDVTLIAEEEIESDLVARHRAVIVSRVKWLRASAFDAVARLAANGGLVILDATVPFDIPGARRIRIDLATGAEPASEVDRFEKPRGPGLDDYGRVDRIRRIADHLEPLLPARMRCQDIRTVAARFRVDGVPCTWFVNAHDADEFMRSRELAGAGHPGARTPEKIAALEAWERNEIEAGPYESTVLLPTADGIPYDVVSMTPVPRQRTGEGDKLTLKMDRFGGALVAWLPCQIREVTLRVPADATIGRRVVFQAACVGMLPERKAAHVQVPGTVPMEFELRDPSGMRQPPSGVHAMKDGSLVIEWSPARNDVPGTWSVAIRELISGKIAERTFVLSQDSR